MSGNKKAKLPFIFDIFRNILFLTWASTLWYNFLFHLFRHVGCITWSVGKKWCLDPQISNIDKQWSSFKYFPRMYNKYMYVNSIHELYITYINVHYIDDAFLCYLHLFSHEGQRKHGRLRQKVRRSPETSHVKETLLYANLWLQNTC